MERISRLFGLIIGLIFVYIFSGGIAAIFTSIFFGDFNKYITVCLANFITLALLYTFSEKDKSIFNKYNIKKISYKEIVYISLFGFGFSMVLLILIDPLTEIFPSYLQVSNQILSDATSFLNLIVIIILGPIFEEVLFRGIIFNHLKNNYSFVVAVILQALLFGLAHGNIVQFIYTSISGILFVLVYIYCGSILGSILLHMVFNFCGSVVPRFLNINDNITYLVHIVGIVCFIFMSFKMLSDYKKRYGTRECN